MTERVKELQISISTASDAFAGTDDTVKIFLGEQSWVLDSPKNDFESGDTNVFDLDPGSSLLLQDINKVRITKSKDGTFGGWKLKGVKVVANSKVIYSNPSINKWLEKGNLEWSDKIVPPLPVTPVPKEEVLFSNSKEINDFFTEHTSHGFITWFNSKVGGHGAWKSRKIGSDKDTLDRFEMIWDEIPSIFDSSSVNLNQFLTLTAIVINENTHFNTTSERGPSLAYFFERVKLRTVKDKKTGKKKDIYKISYNTYAANKKAYDLFRNSDFLDAHGHLEPQSKLVRNLSGWRTDKYPITDKRQTQDANGFVMEADFYKFRGRGWNQITFRGNYKHQIRAILEYGGSNTKIQDYKKRWQAIASKHSDPLGRSTLDEIATRSSTLDWDDLFSSSSDIAFPILSLKTYFQVKAAKGSKKKGGSSSNPLADIPSGSITSKAVVKAIKRIANYNGGKDYEQKLYDRVKQMTNAI